MHRSNHILICTSIQVLAAKAEGKIPKLQ